MSSFFSSAPVATQFEMDGPSAWAGAASLGAMVALTPSYLRVFSCSVLSACVVGSLAYFGSVLPTPCELAMGYLAPGSVAAVAFTALITYSNQKWREESGKAADPTMMMIDSISFVLYIGGGGALILSQVDWSWIVLPEPIVSGWSSGMATCEASAADLGLAKHTLPTLLAAFACTIGITAAVCGRFLDVALAPYSGERAGNGDKEKEQ